MSDEMLQTVAEHVEVMHDPVPARAVFGKPVERGDRTVIPLAEVTYLVAFGAGRGEAEPHAARDEMVKGVASGSLGGGLIRSRPLGILEVTDHKVKLKPVVETTKVAIAGVALGSLSLFLIVRTLVRSRRG